MNTIGKYAVRYLWEAYASLTVLIQMEWQYLHHALLGVGTFMAPMEEALAESFLKDLLVEEEVLGKLRKLLALSAKRAGMGVPDPTLTAYEFHKL